MNYPVWDVPILGSGWVIGIIAIFHVMISHFAIGGGFYLPMAEAKALREGREDWMRTLRGHTKFFLVLTAAYGAVSGVGIWFAIGLASSEATSTLIHYFVFGWAMEWVFFMLEITAVAVYYYTWGKVDDRLHLKVGWVYAGTAWMSLFIINGILTFMLTPGAEWLKVAGTGRETVAFWQAFFNPTFLPSLALRTLVCLALAGAFALLTGSRIDPVANPKLKAEVLRWSVRWLIPAFLLMPICFAWYVLMIPEAQRGLLQLGISTIGQGTFTQLTRSALLIIITSGSILAIAYFMAWKSPLDFKPGHAAAVLFLALAATAFTEHSREMIRKPYVVVDHMFSNGLRLSEVETFNRVGYLTKSPWVRDAERQANFTPAAATPQSQPTADWLSRGEMMFRGQCMACHTLDGYRPLRRLLHDRDRHGIENILTLLHNYDKDSIYRAFMPPLVGTPEEIRALGDYLYTLLPQEDAQTTAIPALTQVQPEAESVDPATSAASGSPSSVSVATTSLP